MMKVGARFSCAPASMPLDVARRNSFTPHRQWNLPAEVAFDTRSFKVSSSVHIAKSNSVSSCSRVSFSECWLCSRNGLDEADKGYVY